MIILSKELTYKDLKVHYHDGKKAFEPKALQLHLEPEQKSGYISGTELFERMKGKGLNSNVLDYLYEHQELVPDEWKDGRLMYFWGTVFAAVSGNLYVRSFYWSEGVCYRDYGWLGNAWRSDRPAVVSANSSKNLDTKDSKTLDLAIERVKQEGYKVIKEI